MSYENERAWYIIQSYSGMENAAKTNLERRIKSMNMEKYIFRVLIPETIRIEKKKNGEIKEVAEKQFPGYIFVDMIVTDESWFIVRNTPMVTGFLGSSGGRAKPVPIPPHEMIPILKKSGITITTEIKFAVGDTVKVISETFYGQEAVVENIDVDNQIVTVLIDMFGRQTPNELRFDEVEPIK
jgi:transcriptional antiterminator NusG